MTRLTNHHCNSHHKLKGLTVGISIEVVNDGATITIAPISLAFADELLVGLKGCELSATLGIDSCIVANAPGDELGCLRLSFDNSLTVSLDALNQFFGITLPSGVAGCQPISVSKNLFVLMILNCITEPENAYRLNLHIKPHSTLSCGKQRLTPEKGLSPIEDVSNE